MNGNTVEHIVRFLEREEEALPARVTNGMILIAVREVKDEVKEVKEALYGAKLDGADGLIDRVERLETFRTVVLWLVSPVVLAFLGGLGGFLFSVVSSQ